MHDMFSLRKIDLFNVSTRVCVSTHSPKCVYCFLIDAHLSDGAQLAMHDVFSLRGIDLFNVSTCVCVSTHSP